MKDGFLAQIDSRIAKLEAELSDLKTARRVYLSVSAEPSGVAVLASSDASSPKRRIREGVGAEPLASEKKDLAGLSIRESAQKILSETGDDWTHYADVSRMALRRGYAGRPTSKPETIAKSFFDIMRQQPDFERDGPRFRLRKANVAVVSKHGERGV
jgi:hypothetical protein